MSTGVHIRAAGSEDRAAILRIWHEGWHDAHAALVPPHVLPYRTPEMFAHWWEVSARERFFVATRAYEVLGFASVEGDEVVKLYVDPAARGQGVAGALLRQGEAVLAEDGIAHAVLYCTLGNTRAERFYRREGWVVDKVIADPVWLPDTRMEAPVLETLCFGKALG